MAIDTVRCRKCGYSAKRVMGGRTGSIKPDYDAMQKVCKNFDFNSTLGCEDFHQAVIEPRPGR